MIYEVAVSCMNLFARLGTVGLLDAYGISFDDYKRFVGDIHWLAIDRARMTKVLHSLVEATVDAQAIPRFPLPAEYIAAGIAFYVAPSNMMAACYWASRTNDSDSLIRQGSPGQAVLPEPVSAQRLFSLVMQLCASSQRGTARALFTKRTGLAMEFYDEPAVSKK